MIIKFLVVLSVNDNKVHIAIPVDFILTVAPIFEASEIIKGTSTPVIGNALIKLKNMQGIEVMHDMVEVLDALQKFDDKTNVVRVDEGKRSLIVLPERKVILTEVVDVSKLN